jgi:hypothetical protein
MLAKLKSVVSLGSFGSEKSLDTRELNLPYSLPQNTFHTPLNRKRLFGKQNKDQQFKNKHLWSERSSAVYEILSPFTKTSEGSWPDFKTLANIDAGLELNVIDTLVSFENQENRGTIMRLYSNLSYFADSYLFTKVIFSVSAENELFVVLL